jgi:hypothetical protein
VKPARERLGRALRGPAGRHLRLILAAAALAIAVLLALLAQDVRSWRDTLRGDSVRYAVSHSAQERWTAPTTLPSGVSGRLLGVDPERRWLSALRLFALAEAVDITGGVTPPSERLFQTTERALSAAAQDQSSVRASQAYTLLGVILFRDAKGGRSSGRCEASRTPARCSTSYASRPPSTWSWKRVGRPNACCW